MSIDNVHDITPRVQYVATAGQTECPYPFPIFDEDDLRVYVDGTLQTKTTDYTVSGVGNDTGGTVTFTSALSGDEVVTIYRETEIARTTDFQQNGPWRSTSTNDELDRITVILQELKAEIGRCLRFPKIATVASDAIELGPIANWLGRYVYINSSGQPEPAAAIELTTLTQSIIGGLLYPQTTAESNAGVTPTDYAFPPGNVLRYGADPTGSEDSTAAFQAATNVGQPVYIPAGTYLVSNVTYTGKVVWVGEGYGSKIRNDTTVLSVTSGTGSVVDNLYLENITAPWIITRDATDWGADISGTLQQSNEVLGYQPTDDDSDIWSSLTSDQQNQQIGPVIQFLGNASDITVSRIYGRFVRIQLIGARRSIVRDCIFRGGKGTFGSIEFDNFSSVGGEQVQPGADNHCINNIVRYGSNSGVSYQRNFDPVVIGNTFSNHGESGIKVAGSDGRECYRAIIVGNKCHSNYYDGIDAVSAIPVSDVAETHHQIIGNSCIFNGGTGINSDGKYNQICDNYIALNWRKGLWHAGSYAHIDGNTFYHNNRENSAEHPQLVGGSFYNVITNNRFYQAVQTAYALYAPNVGFYKNNYSDTGIFFFGTTSAPGVVEGNVDYASGLATLQSFTLQITNNNGTLQHRILAHSGSTSFASNIMASRIAGATNAATNTPTGPDSSTAFAGGGKIGSANANRFWFDTAMQVPENADLMAAIEFNDTGTALNVRAQMVSANINGVTQVRLVFDFSNASSGAPFALNTTNIPSGKTIQVRFRGRLA